MKGGINQMLMITQRETKCYVTYRAICG